jgi:hypothetical protein
MEKTFGKFCEINLVYLENSLKFVLPKIGRVTSDRHSRTTAKHVPEVLSGLFVPPYNSLLHPGQKKDKIRTIYKYSCLRSLNDPNL